MENEDKKMLTLTIMINLLSGLCVLLSLVTGFGIDEYIEGITERVYMMVILPMLTNILWLISPIIEKFDNKNIW